jgi:hypothetical protein
LDTREIEQEHFKGEARIDIPVEQFDGSIKPLENRENARQLQLICEKSDFRIPVGIKEWQGSTGGLQQDVSPQAKPDSKQFSQEIFVSGVFVGERKSFYPAGGKYFAVIIKTGGAASGARSVR